MQIGPYRVVSELARGGMGVVYRAQGADGAEVALKLLLPEQAANERARTRFRKEAETLGRLRHPNLVAHLGHGTHQGAPWLALEFVDGETLQARLRQGPLPVPLAISIARQLAEALAYVHREGLAHRDIKPDNVLLSGEGARLTDFGLVLDEADAQRLTRTGVFLGTPGYWAPEQARGDKAQSAARADLYGLGAVLYACLTGRAPIQATSLQAFMASVEFQRVSPPRAERPEVPEWLSALCMRCLAFDPERRPGSASEVVRCLERATADLDAPPRRAPPLTLALVGVVAALALTLGLVLRGDAPPPAPVA
ncbi:MAG: serine/threonine protein kinase, partial [Planctomycetes bacterium]|nr:serine/threonine protein kinase [Planctomycetota bacterium]